MKAYCLNKISKVALATLNKPDVTVEDIKEADSILVRSQVMHEMELDENILAVARAGAGVNNIPLDKYADKGVVVFNTPGANANAVKELVICGMLLASRDILGGNKWVLENANDEAIAKTAEKAKGQFAGTEIYGKTVAVIGLGAIGILIANACEALGMKVVGYDPFLSTLNALKLTSNIKYFDKLDEAVKDADFVTIHAPAMESTKKMINNDIINKMKNGAILLNFSRDVLVDETAVKEALEEGKLRKYVTDFANPNVVKMNNAIVLPHLGASTEEAEDNCALMAIDELKNYLEDGNIKNSVNYPNVNAGKKQTKYRICINHKNIPGVIAKFSTVAAENNVNIETMVNQSKGNYAYTILDVDTEIDAKEFTKVEGVFRVRVI